MPQFFLKGSLCDCRKNLRDVTQMHQKAPKSKDKVLKCATSSLHPATAFPSQAQGFPKHPCPGTQHVGILK